MRNQTPFTRRSVRRLLPSATASTGAPTGALARPTRLLVLAAVTRSLALAALVALAVTTGCGESGACTEIGCFDEARIDITGLQAGSVYVVVASGDGETNECTWDLTGADPVSVCDGFGGTDGANGVVIVEGAPETVTVTITQDGADIADETLTPVYEDFRPNGEGCEPVCQAGQVTLDL